MDSEAGGSQTSMPLPPVSIVVPLFNREAFILATLETVRAQTHADFEVLIVDNNSSDRGAELVRGYMARDPRFRLIHEPEQGMVPARNRGILEARHEWIAMLDPDDLWMPAKLGRQLGFIRDFEAETGRTLAAVGTYGTYVGEAGRDVGVLETELETLPAFERIHQAGGILYLMHSSVMLRRSIFLEVGMYDPSYDAVCDVELYSRLADHGVVINLPEHLFKYRIHDRSSSTSTFFRMQINALRTACNTRRRRQGQRDLGYEEFEARLDAEPPIRRWSRAIRWRSQHRYRIAGAALANGQYGRGTWHMLRAVALNPQLVARRLFRQVVPFLVRGVGAGRSRGSRS